MTDTPLTEGSYYDLVVAGASAGGIEALSQLLSTLPADFPASVVVAQHLDPHRPSHLGEILGRRTALPIQTIADGASQPLRPGMVYIVPPDRDVEVTDDGMVALHVEASGHSMPSVDRLLASAAHAYGERLIAVILSGSGSDGAVGAREVKAAGGAVVIENPETASYSSMPASLAPATIDLVANLADLGTLLSDLVSGTYVPTQPEDETLLAALLEQVYQQSGVDFAQYKRPTILRRLQRRMAATRTRTVAEYRRYMQQQPQEYTRLATSFLIQVTEFFRDPAVFEGLRERVLPDLIAYARAHHRQLRVWSAGCATGEEPYSLAMLLCEALGEELAQFDVRIFATDVDAQAIAFARRGIYTRTDVAGVPSELQQRYFTATDEGLTVMPVARNLIVFGEHDLGQRAPFPNMDLVLCRNVLIYFTAELQKHALQLFAYALRDGGYLILGQAETVTPLVDLFVPVEDQLKVYRRRGERILVPPTRPRSLVPAAQIYEGIHAVGSSRQPAARSPSALVPLRHPPAIPPEVSASLSRLSTTRERLGALVLGLPLGVLVVDRHYDIQVINTAACELLGIYRPAIGEDILHLVEGVPMAALRTALDAAFRPELHNAASPVRGDQPHEESVVLPTIQGEPHTVQLTLYPILATTDTVPLTGIEDRMVEEVELPTSHQTSTIDAVLLLVSSGPPSASADTVAAPTPTSSQASPTPHIGIPDTGSPDVEPTPEVEHNHLRAELAETQQQRDRLLGSMRDLEAANRELMRVNLDLRQAHEEALLRQEAVQAAEEEVRTLNEELQATNEELETLNEEMEATAEELRATNDDLLTRNQDLQQMAEEREQQRVASEEARARLAAILAQMADPVLVVDTEGRPLISSVAYTALFGDETQDPKVLAHPLQPLDLEGHPLAAGATPWARLRAGEPFQMTFLLIADDGAQRWFETWGQPVHDGQGQRLGGILLIHEITDRTLLHLEERFIQLAVHELRTPLSIVLGQLEMLQRKLSKPSTKADLARIRDMVGHAAQQGEQLRVLLLDLSDIGRAQSDKLQVRHEPVEVLALLRQTIEDVKLAKDYKEREEHEEDAEHAANTGSEVAAPLRIDLDIETEPEIPVWIAADPLRVGQIFTNLLNNAIVHASSSELIIVRVRTRQGMAEVEVADQGPGIPDAEVPYLFTPFRQVIDSTLGQRGGLGLGLFIVQKLVQAHDGTIEVQSKLGYGTTFIVRIPLMQVPDAHLTGQGNDDHTTQA